MEICLCARELKMNYMTFRTALGIWILAKRENGGRMSKDTFWGVTKRSVLSGDMVGMVNVGRTCQVERKNVHRQRMSAMDIGWAAIR